MSGDEAALVSECRAIAEACGAMLAVVGQVRAKGSGTSVGFPDLVLIDSGRVELIEVKRAKTSDHPSGYLSLGQSAFIDSALQRGVHVHVIDSADAFIGVLNGCRKSRGVVRRKR